VDFYRVKVNDKEEAFADVSNWLGLQSESERRSSLTEKETCDKKGGASIGMTKAQVHASCWGKPKSINATITSRGTREQWVYSGSYLYFDETGHRDDDPGLNRMSGLHARNYATP
jgi:hypothetical protein